MFAVAAMTSVALIAPENIPKQLLVAVVWYLAGAMTVFLIMYKPRGKQPDCTEGKRGRRNRRAS